VEGDGDLSRACSANTGLVGLRDVDLRPITTGYTTNLIIGEPVATGDLITSGDTCLFPTIGGLNHLAGLCLLISASLFNGELCRRLLLISHCRRLHSFFSRLLLLTHFCPLCNQVPSLISHCMRLFMLHC
jgi:hypothetical protein